MNLRNKIILEDFRKKKSSFLKLGEIVHNKLNEIITEAGINQILGIEHRIKSDESLIAKLERSGDWYQKLEDLTDLLGARVICFFSDEVDVIGKLVEKNFNIDWSVSSDKRALIKADSFGYVSLHYICYLSKDFGYTEDICDLKFEIQIRTNLQHTWAAINHDLGYKSEFGVPRVVARQFARIAGLLEIADEEFVRAKNTMNEYTDEIRHKIINNEADDVQIDLISLTEYLRRNTKMQEFLHELSEISGAEITEVSPLNYIEQLNWFNIYTLGGIQKALKENYDLALTMAKNALSNTDIDILASNVGLRYILRAMLINNKYSYEEVINFLMISLETRTRAERQAKHLFRIYANTSSQEASNE